MASIFTQIINGDLPGAFVWEDELAIAIMTIAPVKNGHALVIPKQEVDHWDDVPEQTAAHLMLVSQKVTKAIKKAFPSKRVGVVIAGIEVPHTHIHLIPVDELSDFDFSKAFQPEPAELQQHAAKIREQLIAAGYQEAETAANR